MNYEKLGNCCEIEMGQAPEGETYNDQGIGLPLIAGAGDFGDFFPNAKKFTMKPTKQSQKEDIILCIRATIGDVNWSDKSYCLGRGVAGLRVNSDKLNNRFLWHFIQSNKQKLAAQGTGSTFKQVSKNHIFNWEIPLPPLPEQTRIAAILDQADQIRQKRRRAAALADEFLRSVFLEMFGNPVTNPKGWEIGSFSDICELNPKAEKYADDFMVSFVPMAAVAEGTHEMDVNDIRPYADVKKGFTPFKEGDVLFAKITPCMENGKAGIALNLHNGSGFGSTEFHVFRPYKQIYAPFIYTVIHLQEFRDLAANHFTGAVGHKRVPKDFLASFKLYQPPLHLIEKYHDIFQSISYLKSKNDKKVARNETLFHSLSQQFFAGSAGGSPAVCP